MPIKVTCPKCQGVLHAPDDAGGKRGKCPTCGTVLAIPAANGAGPSVGGATLGPAAAAGRPAADPAGYGLLPPAGGETRQSAVPMMPPGKPAAAAKPAAGFGAPPAPKPAARFSRPAPAAAGTADDVADAVQGYRRGRRGLGLVQTGQFFLLLAGLAGPGIAIGRLYGLTLPDKDPGYLGKPGLSAVTEIQYGAVLIPLALGLLLLAIGRLGFGNVPRGSHARGPAKLAGLFSLLAVMGLVATAVVSGNQFLSGVRPVTWKADGLPALVLLPSDEMTGQVQLGGLLAFAVFLVLAEGFFAAAVGRLAAGLHHDGAAGRHTRFVLLTHLLLASGLGVLALYHLDPDLFRQGWNGTMAFADDLLAKAGPARPAAVYGLMAVPSVVVWFLYTRLTGGGRRAIGEWLAAHDPAA